MSSRPANRTRAHELQLFDAILRCRTKIDTLPLAIMTFSAKRNLFFVALCCAAPLNAAILPDGSTLEVRLLNRVGSNVSQVGDRIEAVITTPVFDHGMILLAAGGTVSGVVDHIDRLGLGLRHTAATLHLQFTELHLSGEPMISIGARVSRVEEARESVTDTGAVIGIYPGASFSTGVSGVFSLLLTGEPALRLAVLGFKFLAARSPDAEINFPAGTEMLLRLTQDVQTHQPAAYESAVPLLPASESAYVQNTLARLPQQQTNIDAKHLSDLVNVALIGTREAVQRAFRAAGWSSPEAHGVMAVYHMYHCVVQRVGYSMAPMTNLTLNGHSPDVAFQKNLDTLAKRHHIRLWRDDQSGIWLGAATEDVKFTVRALHVTHATERRVDNERAKVVNDLIMTGCVDTGALIPRADLKPAQEDKHSILTDGDVAILQLNPCDHPAPMPSDPELIRPGRATRIALAVAKDITRSNPVSVSLALANAMFGKSKTASNQPAQQSDAYTRAIAISKFPPATSGIVLAIR